MRLAGFMVMSILGLGLLHAQIDNPADNSTNAPASNPATPQAGVPALTGTAFIFLTACYQGDLAKATQLVDQGVPIETHDNLGRTGLFLACHGSPEIVKLMLAHGARVDATATNGDTTIGRACEYGNLTSAQMLLAAGADFNKVNNYGHTPLMLAAREGHDQLVSLLIDQHVDVNFKDQTDSALVYAVHQNHLSTAKMLLEAGAKPTHASATTNPNRPPPSLLAIASWTDNLELVDLLLDHGLDVNDVGDNGNPALMDVIPGSSPETIKHFLLKGADPSLQNDEGVNAFMDATNYNGGPILQNLLDHGAKLEAKDKQGRTALMWACHYVYFPAVHFLIDQGADINATDSNGETPLTYAGDRGDADLVQLLTQKGATRTDIHIIAKPKPTPPLSPTRSWALAVAAIYPQTGGTNPQILGNGNTRNVSKMLEKDWKITDRTSFLKEINNLRSSGHHDQYQQQGALLAALSDTDFASKIASLESDEAARATALRTSYLKWKDRSGLAWDLCRAANLISLGFQAQYLNEEDAWNILTAIATQTQNSFTSWQEMSDNFLDGREIWYGSRDPHFEACAKLLLNASDPNSPWNQNPWKTNLSSSAEAN